jgi:predicted HTH domain antitoxin
MAIKTTTKIESPNVHHVLTLAQRLTRADQHWLAEQLNSLTNETAMLELAIQQYVNNQCNLNEAAKLANMTREEMAEILDKRGLFLDRYGYHNRSEIEALNERLEREGILSWQPKRPFDPEIDNNCVTIHEAIGLYLIDACSLNRVADLAGVTRWDIIDILKQLDIPIMLHSSKKVEDMDELCERLERLGILSELDSEKGVLCLS